MPPGTVLYCPRYTGVMEDRLGEEGRQGGEVTVLVRAVDRY